MKTQAIKSRHLSMLIMGIAVIVFGAAVSAAIMRWLPVATAQTVGDSVQTPSGQADGQVRAKSRCPGCGVIVSMREIDGQDEKACSGATGTVADGIQDGIPGRLTGGYEITVRMADGSSRVIEAANAAAWRRGERLIVIAGAIPPLQ